MDKSVIIECSCFHGFWSTEGFTGGGPEGGLHGAPRGGGAVPGRGAEKFLRLPALLSHKGKLSLTEEQKNFYDYLHFSPIKVTYLGH